MYSVDASETKLLKELVKELNEFNTYIKTGSTPYGLDYRKGSYFCAFNPTRKIEMDFYKRGIRLMTTITDILDENCLNMKSHGYTYVRDAICIIADMESIDISLTKDVYPLIAGKYTKRNVGKVEHSIRNVIDSAYKVVNKYYPYRDCIMNSFEKKPSSKRFLLRAVREVENRLLK